MTAALSRVRDSLPSFETLKQLPIECGKKTYNTIRNIPTYMENNRAVALGFFATINLVTLPAINFIANFFDTRVSTTFKLTETQKSYKKIVDAVLFGAMSVAINYGLSYITHYPLSRFAYGIIFTATAAARYIYKTQSVRIDPTKKSEELKEEERKALERKVVSETGAEVKEITQSYKYVRTSAEQDQALQTIVTDISVRGYTKLTEKEDVCFYAFNAYIIAFEEWLAQNKDITDVTATYLMTEPFFALQNPLIAHNTAQPMEVRDWMGQKRPHSVANLMKIKDVNVHVAYSRDAYSKIADIDYFDDLITHKKFTAHPLNKEVPTELESCSYEFKKQDRLFQLTVRLSNEQNGNMSCSIWFGEENNPELKPRMKEVAAFIAPEENNGNQNNGQV